MRRLPLLLLFVVGCGPGLPPVPAAPPPKPVEDYADIPLVVGDKVPPYAPAGWLNGPPKAYDAVGVKLTVIDIWSTWCPFCKQTAPGLAELHARYKDRGVQFVSLTNLTEPAAESYQTDTQAAWPCGHGLPLADISALGAIHPGQHSEGMALAPTLYIVGPDGKLRWTDKRARLRHTPPEKLFADMDAALTAELAK